MKKLVLLMVLVVMMVGCITQHRVNKYVKLHGKLMRKDRGAIAVDSLHQVWYPEILVKSDTEMEREKLDTGKDVAVNNAPVFVNCDSLELLKQYYKDHPPAYMGKMDSIGDMEHVECPPCPPSWHRVDTIIIPEVITNVMLDSAFMDETHRKMNDAVNECAVYKRKAEIRGEISVILGLCLLLIVIATIWSLGKR